MENIEKPSVNDCKVSKKDTNLPYDIWMHRNEKWTEQYTSVRRKYVKIEDINFSFCFCHNYEIDWDEYPCGKITAKICWADKPIPDQLDTICLFGNYDIQTNSNVNNCPSREDEEKAKTFFKKYKILFNAVWEFALYEQDLVDYFFGRISIHDLVLRMIQENVKNWSCFAIKELKRCESLEELKRIVVKYRLFNTNEDYDKDGNEIKDEQWYLYGLHHLDFYPNCKEFINGVPVHIDGISRIGEFGKFQVFVCSDSGIIPHFHIWDKETKGRKFHICLDMFSPEYVCQKQKEDKLSEEEKYSLMEFLKKPDKDNSEWNNWNAMLAEWNSNNENNLVNIDEILTDYIKLK